MDKHNKSCGQEILTDDFNVYTSADFLPFTEHSVYVKEGICGLCTGGNALFDVHTTQKRVVKDDLVVIFPHHLAAVTDRSDDFSMTFFKVTYPLFIDTLSGVCQMTIAFFFFMKSNFCRSLSPQEVVRFMSFCSGFESIGRFHNKEYRREGIMHLLRVLYWSLFVYYKENAANTIRNSYSRQEEIAFDFFNLVVMYYNESRDVAFYAHKMCISPKYLTMIIKAVSGRPAKEFISEYTIIEIKSLLRDTSLSIKEVVMHTNFQSQSIMSRFFRKHTGMSPTDYRMKLANGIL